MTLGILGACREATARALRGFDSREMAILRDRVFGLTERRTLQEIANQYSLTRERVRQIEKQATTRIRTRVHGSTGELLRRGSRYLRGAMGAACPVDKIVFERSGPGANSEETPEDLTLAMLIWLAGPYEVYRGWLVRAPAESVVALTKQVFRKATGGREPLEMGTVIEALNEINVHERWAIDWLLTVEKVKILDGKVCRWSGGLLARVYQVLRVRGTPMTVDEIWEAIEKSGSRGSLVNGLAAHRDRFRRTGPRVFGLTEWGGLEHMSVKEFVISELAKLGGVTKKGVLIDKTMTALGVPKRTVATVLSNPMFVHISAGRVRMRTAGDPIPKIHPIEFSKHCYKVNYQGVDGRSLRAWSYRVEVDSETLRGSGTVIPAAFGTLLGLRPGERKTVESLFGELQFSWLGPQANVGSLREAASGLKASVGDFLYLVAIEPSKVAFLLIRAEDVERVSGWEQICLRVSGTPGDSKESRIAEVGVAIGLADASGFTIGDIRRRLELRRERELLDLIPESDLLEESEGLNELVSYAFQ